MATKTALLAAVWLTGQTIAAPTGMNKAFDVLQSHIATVLDQLCSSKHCLSGDATFDLSTFTCSCPELSFGAPCGSLYCKSDQEPFYSVISNSCYCGTMEDWHTKEDEVDNALFETDQQPMYGLQRRQAPPDPIPTFIPPPKKDITPELIQQSLSVQPQNTAVISSVVPYFHDGVIRVYLQLDGPVATTLVVNSSTSLPCGTIGLVDPQPNLGLVPLIMNEGQGQPQTIVADCECIAVNMYQPYIVTYWIQKLSDGSIYSVLGNNLVKDIDKMNTTQSTALTLTTLSPGASKRSLGDSFDCVNPQKRQFWRVSCDSACPLPHMRTVKGTGGDCACIFKGADEELVGRDLIQPDLMTAKMTAKACAEMTCRNPGGTPTTALWNPFHETCWCITQPYIESNPDAWTPSS